MNASNVIQFKPRTQQDAANAVCFEAMLNEAIEGMRHRRASKRQREERRLERQLALNLSVEEVLRGRDELAVEVDGVLTISFQEASCQLLASLNGEGQVDLSWVYEGRSEPKYSGTVDLDEARDIILHLVAVRIAAIRVDSSSVMSLLDRGQTPASKSGFFRKSIGKSRRSGRFRRASGSPASRTRPSCSEGPWGGLAPLRAHRPSRTRCGHPRSVPSDSTPCPAQGS